MKPFDRRLLHYTKSTRVYVGGLIGIGVLLSILIAVQAKTVAHIIVSVTSENSSSAPLTLSWIILAFVIFSRACFMWLQAIVANRCSASAKADLRRRVIQSIATGPSLHAQQRPTSGDTRTGETATVIIEGLDALDNYFSKYFPQLILAVLIPVVVLTQILNADLLSAGILIATIPIIPIFMILIGQLTQNKMNQQLQIMSSLSGTFLELTRGLRTLRIFGKAEMQVRVIADASKRLNAATMTNLRVAFLSSFVLELCATLGVALVAVSVGLRLAGGDIGYEDALVVLLLAPEIYTPLRALGTQFHANTQAMEAADTAFKIVESSSEPRAMDDLAVPQSPFPLAIHNPAISHGGSTIVRINASFTLDEGERIFLVGRSGIGKSSLLDSLMGFAFMNNDAIQIGSVPIHHVDLHWWRDQVAWVPQNPHIFAGTIASNVRVGNPAATEHEIQTALMKSELWRVVSELPNGIYTAISERGLNLSAGERQRLALARAFVRNSRIIILDEPTANLDSENEQFVVKAISTLIEGRAAIIATHRSSTLEHLVAPNSKTIFLTNSDAPLADSCNT